MDDIVLSMSAISTYQRCRKKFKLSYVEGMEDADLVPSEALEKGTSFHKHMEDYYLNPKGAEQNEMSEVAREFIKRRPMPDIKDVLQYGDVYAVDKPFLYKLPYYSSVYLRCSFDLAYRSNDIFVIRDYKTFSRAPSFNIDLDFQGRMYLAFASKLWGPGTYKFEHEMVRTEAPGTAHGNKPVKYWTEEECYFHHSMILPKEEMEDDWQEILSLVDEIVNKLDDPCSRYQRSPQKGGGYMDCSSCNVKNLCIAQKQGNLDSDNIRNLSKPHPVIWGLNGLQR
jgi:CRISPR/Cas system-associated exonuclease Cas4 (RecB family)